VLLAGFMACQQFFLFKLNLRPTHSKDNIMTDPTVVATKLNIKLPSPESAESAESAEALVDPFAPAEVEDEDINYHHYSYSQPAVRLITPNGKKIQFIGFKFITADVDCIEYLDHEIKTGGIKGFTIGQTMSAKEADPLVSLRREIYAQFVADAAAAKAKIAAGNTDYTGADEPKPSALKPTTTKGIAS